MTSPDTPALLAKQSLPSFDSIQRQAEKLDHVRLQLTVLKEQEKLLCTRLLKEIKEWSGATVSTDAFKTVPEPERSLANAPVLQQLHPSSSQSPHIYPCTCPSSNLGRKHLSSCSYWKTRTPNGSGATAEAVSLTATVIHPPLKRASAAAACTHPATCTPSFCLKGWRGDTYCSATLQKLTEEGNLRAEKLTVWAGTTAEEGEGATGGGSGATDTDKPPVVINITPTDLSDSDQITLYQLKARAEAYYHARLQDTDTYKRDTV